MSWYSLGIMVFSHYAVGGEQGTATYSVEFEPLVGLLIVVPDRPVVLVHHDAWAAPVQMHVDNYQSVKYVLFTDELFVVRGDELEELLGGLDGGDNFLLLLRGHYDLNL